MPRRLLTDFLKTRRARLQPADVGLHDSTGVRRTPGLRRAEAAQLAGISEERYMHFEMGRERAMTPRLVARVARALGLNAVERSYLADLAAAAPPEVPAPNPAVFGRGFDDVDDVVMIVYDRWMNAVYGNAAALALAEVGADDPRRRNALLGLFRLPSARAMYGDRWEAHTRLMLGVFRRNLARDPLHPDALRVIEDLAEDPEFRRLWDAHEVHSLGEAAAAEGQALELTHPRYGSVRLRTALLGLPGVAGDVRFLTPVDPADTRILRTITAMALTDGRVSGAQGVLSLRYARVRSAATTRAR